MKKYSLIISVVVVMLLPIVKLAAIDDWNCYSTCNSGCNQQLDLDLYLAANSYESSKDDCQQIPEQTQRELCLQAAADDYNWDLYMAYSDNENCTWDCEILCSNDW